jgi:hypothetical protein
MPTRAAHKSSDGTQVETVTSMSFDDVADSVCELPDSGKTLLDKRDRRWTRRDRRSNREIR